MEWIRGISGNSCPQGECAAAGISVLRLLAAAQPDAAGWIDQLVDFLGRRKIAERKNIRRGYLQSDEEIYPEKCAGYFAGI